MVKPKRLYDYVKRYKNELSRLVQKIPEEIRMLLPEHVVANQEIQIYMTKETGIAIDYLGINPRLDIRIEKSDRCVGDLVFPPTDSSVPCSFGALKFKPLAKSSPNEHTTTLSLVGSMQGIVLFKMTGMGHLFAYEDPSSGYGRYTLFNIFVQRQYPDGGLRSRFVRYAEFYPDKPDLFTKTKAVANARYDLAGFMDFVKSPEFGPITEKYLTSRMGEVIVKLKSNSVIVLGKDTYPELKVLRRICDELRTLEYHAFLAKEQPDIPGQSLEEKVKLLTLISKFAVMEDSIASGHIAEFEYCKTNRVPLILLRREGKGSTWMIGDAGLVDVNYIKKFEYSESTLHDVLDVATDWVEKFIERKAEVYGTYYPWLGKENS